MSPDARTVAMDSLRVEGLLRLRLPGSLVLRCSRRTVLPGFITMKLSSPVETGPFHFAGSQPSAGTASWIRSGRTQSDPVGDLTHAGPQASGADDFADPWGKSANGSDGGTQS